MNEKRGIGKKVTDKKESVTIKLQNSTKRILKKVEKIKFLKMKGLLHILVFIIIVLASCSNNAENTTRDTFMEFYNYLLRYPNGKVEVIDSDILTYSYIDSPNNKKMYSYFFDKSGHLKKYVFYCNHDNKIVHSIKFQNGEIIAESGHSLYLIIDDSTKDRNIADLYIYCSRINGYVSKIQLFEHNLQGFHSRTDEYIVKEYATFFEIDKRDW